MRVFSFIILLFLVTSAWATSQIMDSLVYRGETGKILDEPLKGWLEQKGITLFRGSSANWRGYVATWEIANDKLYLNSFEGDEKHKDLNSLIPKNDGKVLADWYTGRIHLALGKMLKREPYVTERQIVFTVYKGVVKSSFEPSYPDVDLVSIGIIHVAAEVGDVEELKKILAANANAIRELTSNGLTPLHWAVKKKQIEAAHFLLSKGADPNLNSDEGTPLCLAMSQVAMMDLLVEKGALVKMRDDSPLRCAIAQRNLEAVNYLIQKGAEVNKDIGTEGTILLRAVQSRSLEIVESLLSHGANPNQLISAELFEEKKNLEGFTNEDRPLRGTVVCYAQKKNLTEETKLLEKFKGRCNGIVKGLTPEETAWMRQRQEKERQEQKTIDQIIRDAAKKTGGKVMKLDEYGKVPGSNR
jgi:hypothetical protein